VNYALKAPVSARLGAFSFSNRLILIVRDGRISLLEPLRIICDEDARSPILSAPRQSANSQATDFGDMGGE
jgi:hypothetical protein